MVGIEVEEIQHSSGNRPKSVEIKTPNESLISTMVRYNQVSGKNK
jgi:hypothetical protein